MIDWDRVSELRDEVGADDFDEVVDLLLSHSFGLLIEGSLLFLRIKK